MTAPKPPPPPPPRPPGRPPPLPARPSFLPLPVVPKGAQLSQASKDAIAETALGLLEEQVRARIVHYKVELETNPELDAITAQVVAELRQLQEGAGATDRAPASRVDVAEAHERALRGLLEKVIRQSGPTPVLDRALRKIHRRLARLFFESELHEKTRGQDGVTKVIQHPEQALYYLLTRYQHRLANELGGFDFASAEVRERSFELLARVSKDLQDGFLSRRSLELKRIVSGLHAVLLDFFAKQLAPNLGQLAKEVVTQAGTAEGRAVSYKVAVDVFPRFRTAFERRLMVRLVGFVEDALIQRLADTADGSREETLRFVTDPRLFSMICGELADELYDYLANEGFLEVPADYRNAPRES